MTALAINEKGEVYAEIDLSVGDRTAIPAGYSLLGDDMWHRVMTVAKTVTEDATITALSLMDKRVVGTLERGNVGTLER